MLFIITSWRQNIDKHSSNNFLSYHMSENKMYLKDPNIIAQNYEKEQMMLNPDVTIINDNTDKFVNALGNDSILFINKFKMFVIEV